MPFYQSEMLFSYVGNEIMHWTDCEAGTKLAYEPHSLISVGENIYQLDFKCSTIKWGVTLRR